MKKVYLIITAVAAIFVANSQSLSPTVIASTGAYSVNTQANVSLSYTVGEMTMVQTFTGGNTILTQGFQQPNDFGTGIVDITPGDFGSFMVYPNPAVENVWFGFKLPEQGKVNISMYNELGQKVADLYNSNYENGDIVQQTNVSTLAAGMYFMTMTFTSTKDGQTHIQTKKFQVMN